MPAYATPADLIARYDARTVGELCTDDEQVLTRTAVLAHENVLKALQASSGRVEAALLRGARYSVDDLNNLTDNSQEHLIDIVCTIAMKRLLRRRPGCFVELMAQVDAEAEEYLEDLKKGHEVFTIDAHVAAGLIEDGGNGNLENVQLLNQRNNLTDNMIARMFPHRGDTGRRRREFG